MPRPPLRRAGLILAALLAVLVAVGMGGAIYLDATQQAVNLRGVRDEKLNALRCDYWRPSLRSGEEVHAYAFGADSCRWLVPVHQP